MCTRRIEESHGEEENIQELLILCPGLVHIQYNQHPEEYLLLGNYQATPALEYLLTERPDTVAFENLLSGRTGYSGLYLYLL